MPVLLQQQQNISHCIFLFLHFTFALVYSLRTLEFWADNLNPDFLYPILAAQKDVLVELMQGLTSHLRPAPYPYGLLTLRLLGKLGGKNRLWLGEPIPVLPDSLKDGTNMPKLSVEGIWDGSVEDSDDMEVLVDGEDSGERFTIPLPIVKATAILRAVAVAPNATIDVGASKPKEVGSDSSFRDSDGFLSPSFYNSSEDIGGVHLPTYCVDVLEATKREQASSALAVLRSALSVTIDLPATSSSVEENGIEIKFARIGDVSAGDDDDNSVGEKSDPTQEEPSAKTSLITNPTVQSGTFAHIVRGLFYATQVPDLRGEAKVLLVGLTIHMLLISESHREHIVPVDGDGKRAELFHGHPEDEEEKSDEGGANAGGGQRRVQVANGKIHSLPPFGNFRFEGDLKDKVSCFLINDVIAAMLCEGGGVKDMAIELIGELVEISRRASEKASANKDEQDEPPAEPCGSLFLESLLSSLLGNLFASSWPCRAGIYCGIVKLIQVLSSGSDDNDNSSFSAAEVDFVALYEFELVHAALFCLRNCPRESPLAAKDALEFYFEVWSVLYGPILSNQAGASDNDTIRDCIFVENEPEDMNDLGAFVPVESCGNASHDGGDASEKGDTKKTGDVGEEKDEDKDEPGETASSAILPHPSSAILELLLMEMCSTKQLLR